MKLARRHIWVVRAVVLWILVAVMGAACGGCGSESTKQAQSLEGRSLSRGVRTLNQGASVEVVEAQLGEPLARYGQRGQIELNYGDWQLVFVDQGLRSRTRVLVPNATQAGSQGMRPLGETIRRLKLGATITSVKNRLGTPEVIYEMYEAQNQPAVILRYGAWELTFIGGHLVQRAQ